MTVASGGVTSLGTFAGEDARSLMVLHAGEPTTGSYNYKIITLVMRSPRFFLVQCRF